VVGVAVNNLCLYSGRATLECLDQYYSDRTGSRSREAASGEGAWFKPTTLKLLQAFTGIHNRINP
jgi:hypothetical protein